MGFGLIPVSDRCYIVSQGLKLTVRIPTERLNCDAKVGSESDRVKYVEAVKAMAGNLSRVSLSERVAEEGC